MSEMPGYEWPTFIMISRRVRPMATLTADTDPGPRAHTPWFMPISSAIGPLTITIGAWGPVDIANVRSPITSSSTHSAIARITGIAFGLRAGHHRVRGDLLDGADAHPGREHADHVVGRTARRRDHRVDLRPRRRHQRQAVAPPVARRTARSSRRSTRAGRRRRTTARRRRTSVRWSNTGRARSAVGVVVSPSITCASRVVDHLRDVHRDRRW